MKAVCLCTHIKNKPWCKSGNLRCDSSCTELFRHQWQTLSDSFQWKQKVSAHTWKRLRRRRGLDRNQWLNVYPCECFHSPNATTKPASDEKWQAGRRCEHQQVIAEFLSRVKKLHTHLLWEGRGKKMARECTAEASENSTGICSLKGLRGARWGTDRLFVNRGITYYSQLSMGPHRQFQVKRQVWIQQLNAYLIHCCLKWALSPVWKDEGRWPRRPRRPYLISFVTAPLMGEASKPVK